MTAQLALVINSTAAPSRNATTAARAVASLRDIVASLDEVLASLDPDPADGSACPQPLAAVQGYLLDAQRITEEAGLGLLHRVLARALAFVVRLRSGKTEWSLMAKLAVEELVSVVDMVLDVVELVNEDSGCRHEERVTFRILASVAPQVLTDVDGMDFRQIRFHQVAGGGRALKAG